MIDIKNLTMDYGSGPILQDVNLHINKGEAVTIIGGSGCGKSTLLRCVNKLITPTSGEIWIEGENILAPDADVTSIRKKMGMVYQSFNLFSHLSVVENIVLAPVKVLGVPREDAVKEAEELLRRVGLISQRDKMPSSLSGGQKQRVAIVRALAMHPDLMLFDEPTSALDPTMVDEVESVIRDLVEDSMTSIIVTHEMRFAKNISSKVVFLAEKGIYEVGTPEEIFDSPKKPLTQQFIYRSRMFEKKLHADDLDKFGLPGELAAFMGRFEHNAGQLRGIASVCDELIYPVMDHGAASSELRLICSAESTSHMLMVRFPEIDSDPLLPPYTDELNVKILEHAAGSVFSHSLPNGGYEVCIQF